MEPWSNNDDNDANDNDANDDNDGTYKLLFNICIIKYCYFYKYQLL